MIDLRNPGAIGYFDKRIDDFDSIYNEHGGGLRGWLNRTLRKSVSERFRLAFNLLGDMTGKSVLDIGCGTGRYMFESVKRGATEVVGLDAAGGAISAARLIARELGIENRVQLVQADFIDYEVEHSYDIIFAIGYFDYILDPALHLRKMLEACDGFLIASFPKRWHLLTPVRKVRLMLNGCPVRFYSRHRIERMLRDAGRKNNEIKSVARDFVVIIRR
jgi:SAM-dependent methyltransferase